ncbi:MAG: membrane dipeptidase [Oscillospiraceae bacterium]|nr:membrane dipeptidase [Oscillospiraceae bacterium]
MNFPVFDLHCDTALRMLTDDKTGAISLKENALHIDLQRAKKLHGYAQCFACFTTPDFDKWYGKSPVLVFEREMAQVLSQVEANADVISLAYTADDVRKNYEQGKMSAILTIEGPAGFGFDPELLPDLYQVGFRMSTLGWNESNPLTGSHITGEGLTDLGREYVRLAQILGMVVDVSHISDKGFWDIMDITDKPIVASHSNSRAVHGCSRNLTDDMFKAICQTGGVAGLNQYADFIGNKPTLDSACDHILHWLELDPEGSHIALGGDLDGCEELVDGFTGVESYPALAVRLLERGVGETIVRKIFWDNALGVMEVCCM